MSQTALVELRTALADLLAGDGALDALLSGRKVFALQAPAGAALNYVVIGPVILDLSAGYYSQPGRRHRRRLTAWARTAGTAEEIYARLAGLLDGTLLSLTGHTMQQSSLSLLAGPREDEDRKAWGVDADWSVSTLEDA